jgi:hypothetical protein
LEAEVLGQRGEMDVPGVDELATVLGDLRAVEFACAPASAADAIARLVDREGEPGSHQPVGGRESGEAGADHRDSGTDASTV